MSGAIHLYLSKGFAQSLSYNPSLLAGGTISVALLVNYFLMTPNLGFQRKKTKRRGFLC